MINGPGRSDAVDQVINVAAGVVGHFGRLPIRSWCNVEAVDLGISIEPMRHGESVTLVGINLIAAGASSIQNSSGIRRDLAFDFKVHWSMLLEVRLELEMSVEGA